MKKNKVQVFRGTGSFIEPKRVKVQDGEDEGTELEAANVLLATGSAVATLPGLELDGGKVISSDDVVTSTDDPPASVIVLGSGAVGVEFASLYNDFGTDVTLVELLHRTVPTEDAEISAELEKAFERRGIRVITSTKADPSSLEKTEDGVTIKVQGEDGEETLEAEVLLVAVGRTTVVEALNLDATEVQLDDRGQIQVDEFYRTAEPGVYAAGDVIGGYWLAHAAGHEGIVAVEHMAGEDPRPIDQNLIPRVTFCRPEVASFGLTKQQAEEQGHQVKESKFPFRAIGKGADRGRPGRLLQDRRRCRHQPHPRHARNWPPRHRADRRRWLRQAGRGHPRGTRDERARSSYPGRDRWRGRNGGGRAGDSLLRRPPGRLRRS